MKGQPSDLIAQVWKRYDYVVNQGETLSESIQSWVTDHPITCHAEIAEDRLSWQLLVEIHDPPLDDWGFNFGDAVHNLRACLDNMAWALANTLGPPKKPKQVQFPIVTREANWKDERRRISELPPRAQTAIEQIQPFQRPRGTNGKPAEDPLVMLAEFSNSDKHRVGFLPQVNTAAIGHAFTVQFESEEKATAEGSPRVEVNLEPFTADSVLMHQTTSSPIVKVIGALDVTALVAAIREDGVSVGVTQSLATMAHYTKKVMDYVLTQSEP